MTVHYEIDGAVATFTLDNGRHNFLNVNMYRRLTELLTEFDRDDSVRVGVLTGLPGTSFCAGDDLKARPRPIEVTPHWPTEMLTAPRAKPMIAAVHGWCLGGGFQTLLGLTDLRVVTVDAKLGFPEIAYGMGGAGGATRLDRHLPRAVALQLVLTGDYLTAAQAHRVGLVNQIVEVSDLAASAFTLAGRVAEHPLIALTTELAAFNTCEGLSAGDALKAAGSLYRQQVEIHEQDNPYSELKPRRPQPIDLGLGPGL